MKKIVKTIEKIKPLNQEAIKKCQQRLDILTKPRGSLGVLEEIALQLAGILGNPMPKLQKKVHIIMAADHGIAKEGVSAFPQEVTPQMVLNFLSGGAAINVLCRLNGTEVVCVDIGVASDIKHPNLIVKKICYGTRNMTKGAAMTRDEAIQALTIGIEMAEEQIRCGAGILSIGEMGIGNTSSSSAIAAIFTKKPIDLLIGRGTGVNDKYLQIKKEAIEEAIKINQPNINDATDVLAKVGGLEIGGMAGVILGAAANGIPIIIDGFISTAAAMIAAKLAPESVKYMIGSHRSEEPGHKIMLEELGIHPMLHMNMRLGEGTGAILALNLVEASIRILHEMATFESAGVSNEKK